MGNRIFYGFLILVFSALLWLIPIESLVYDFRTDISTDEFYVATPVGTTNATVVLNNYVYDNDTATIGVISDLNSDVPTFTSYNTTSRATVFTSLTDNATRTLTVTYDTDALNSSSWSTILDIFPKIWMILIISFPVAGMVAILIMRRD